MHFAIDFRDAHFLELAAQLKIDINKEVHLMSIYYCFLKDILIPAYFSTLVSIEDFIRSREKDEKWFFRQTADGQSFWVNHEHKTAVKEYPHLDELKKYIEEARKRFKKEQISKYKKDGTLIKTLFRKYTEETAMRILMQEAKNFVEFYVANKDALKGETAAVFKALLALISLNALSYRLRKKGTI
mgnify:FL=1